MNDKDAQRRAEKIAGLRELLDFLEAHPDVPLPRSVSIEHCVGVTYVDDGGELSERSDEEGVAEVARIAALLSVAVEGNGPSVEASRNFGTAEYRTFFIGQKRARDWSALTSYDGNIEG